MADTISPERRSWNMSRIRSRDTEPERAVRTALRVAGYRYRLHVKSLPGKPDIVLARYRLAVFVHGCFWHGHVCWQAKPARSNRRYWGPKIAGNMARDRRNQRLLRRMGWSCHVVRECTVQSGIRRLLTKIGKLRT